MSARVARTTCLVGRSLRAALDLEKAKHFFSVEIPIISNPLNLYDDIDGGFVVDLFKDSDKECFYVLSEFRKTINLNVLKLSVLFSLICLSCAVRNLSLSFFNVTCTADDIQQFKLHGTLW